MEPPARRRPAAAHLGAGATAGALPPTLRTAVADASGKRGSLAQVEHVVVLMQENRSFDHYFGSLPGVRGFGDQDMLTLSTGQPIWYQPDLKHPRGCGLQVSWIIGPAATCEHPSYLPAAGAVFISQILEVLAASPKVWEKTVFFLNYDENDGLFDHLPPPVPPAGTADEFVDGLPIGLGFRVPMIVISPFSVGGRVSSEVYDHTSVLRFMAELLGLEEPNISAGGGDARAT